LMTARFDDLSRTPGSWHGRAPLAELRPLLHYFCDGQ
jgi:hypothetical protein